MENFNETALPEKEELYRNLNIEEITNVDYMRGKIVCEDFEIKNLCEYYYLHLKSDRLFLVDGFENFRKMCSKIYQLNPAKFLSSPGLAR